MNIIILGAAGFIGTNLVINLVKSIGNKITLVDKNEEYFSDIKKLNLPDIEIKCTSLKYDDSFDKLLSGQDILYHLVSTTVPITSNQHISQELQANVIFSANLFEACIRCGVKKVVFISSGGAIYGKKVTAL